MTLRARDGKRKAHITIRLEPDELRQIRKHAEDNERTVSAELRLAVRAYLAEKAAA